MLNEFDHYRLYYYSAPQYNWEVLVDLFKDSKNVGRLLFWKSGLQLPRNQVASVPTIYYPMSAFPNVMSILLHEKPLWVNVDSANGIGHISTTDESIGELEPTPANAWHVE